MCTVIFFTKTLLLRDNLKIKSHFYKNYRKYCSALTEWISEVWLKRTECVVLLVYRLMSICVGDCSGCDGDRAAAAMRVMHPARVCRRYLYIGTQLPAAGPAPATKRYRRSVARQSFDPRGIFWVVVDDIFWFSFNGFDMSESKLQPRLPQRSETVIDNDDVMMYER